MLHCSYKQNGGTDDKILLNYSLHFWNVLGFRKIASFPKHFS